MDSLPLPQPANAGMPEVRDLCARLVPGGALGPVRVEPPEWALLDDCMINVERYRELHGGSIHYGWQLWETLPGVMIEAEFHAVWFGGPGLLLDVTPKPIPLDEIQFLHDPDLIYAGRQINNVRVALQDDPAIRRFIAANEQLFEAMNRGHLAHYHGPVVRTPEIQKVERKIARRGEELRRTYYSKKAA